MAEKPHIKNMNKRYAYAILGIALVTASQISRAQEIDLLDMLPVILSAIKNGTPAPPSSGSGSGITITDVNGRTCAISGVQLALLTSHNAARANSRTCWMNGVDTFFPAAAPVTWNCDLGDAAAGHSAYMASITTLTHTGAGNTNAGQRINQQGYTWNTWAENIARGYSSSQEVTNEWLLSTSGHCNNIMRSSYEEMGAARVNNSQNFWTVVFARQP